MTIASRARSRTATVPASPRVVVSEARFVHAQINACVAPRHFAERIIVGHAGGQTLKWPLARLGFPSAFAVNLVGCLCEPLWRGFPDACRGVSNEGNLSIALGHQLPLTTAPIALRQERTLRG